MKHFDWSLEVPDLPALAFRRSMGKKMPQTLEGGGAPAAPSPVLTGMAQTVTNQQSAGYNKDLNLNNYSNPFGAQNSYVIGTGPSGAPIYNTNTTASPALQGQMNSLLNQTAYSGDINQNAISGLGGLSGAYGNVNSGLAGLGAGINPQAAQQAQQRGQQAAYQSQSQYLDPQFQQQGASLTAQLANQGITPGSEAYNNAMTNFNNTKQKAYSDAANQSELTGSQIGTQNWQNQLAGVSANQGLYSNMAQNLTSQAGLYGQMVGIGQSPYGNLQTIAGLMPGYSGPSSVSTNPADIGGYINQAYQGQLASANAKTASNNALIGAGGTALGAYLASDAGAAAIAAF